MTGNIILDAAIILGILGAVAAIILFFVSKAFRVEEDPRIDEVVAHLPGANCGGCGFAGCRALAEAIVKQGNLEGIGCPGAGAEANAKISAILGIEAVAKEPKIAVIRCNGTQCNSPAKTFYDSALTCTFANNLFAGEGACPFGCLGCGDCVKSCKFGAITMDPETNLPVVNEELCVGCGVCAKNCVRHVIEIRNKGLKGRRVFVACNNQEKGGVARKNCSAACIGCGKCAKVCPFEAITVENNLAYIDFNVCKLCRKCEAECPTGAIHTHNFPPRKVAAPAEQAEAVKEPAQL